MPYGKFQTWETPPSEEQPRWQLEYWNTMQRGEHAQIAHHQNVCELQASTYEEAVQEAEAILRDHDGSAIENLIGKSTRPRIKKVLAVANVEFDK